MHSYLRRMFSLDLRSIALLRIGVGIVLLLDIISRAKDLIAHYTDTGVLSRADLLAHWNNDFFISVHMASGGALFQAVLFLVAGVFAVMLILGYRTRLAAIVSWFLLISLHARNPLILQGGDVVFRVVLFFMLFLPLGSRYSLDSFFGKAKKFATNSFFGAATAAYIIQLILIYVMSGYLKTGIAWHSAGDAVYYALSLDQFIRPFGAWLNTHDQITTFLTHATIIVETYATLLFISPIWNGWLRILAFLLLAGLQIGFNVSMHLGLFGAIMIATMLGILPKEFWQYIAKPVHRFFARAGKRGLSIYFDNECSFCAKVVRLFKKIFFLHPDTAVLPARENSTIEKEMLARDSWVVVSPDGVHHYGFAGFITVISFSPIFRPFTSFFRGMSTTGEEWYRRVAKRRMSICLPPFIEKELTVKQKVKKIVQNTTVIFFIGYAVLWNIDTIPGKNFLPTQWERVGWLTRLDQKFNMFAPTPLTEDGWYVMPGTLQNGTTIDVYRNALVVYAKPEHVAKLYPNQRWQKYLMNLWLKDYSQYRAFYGKYVCREWNKDRIDGEKLQSFEMIFMLEKSGPRHTTFPVQPTTVWNQTCL